MVEVSKVEVKDVFRFVIVMVMYVDGIFGLIFFSRLVFFYRLMFFYVIRNDDLLG